MKIFLSHSTKDKPFVRQISKALKSQGYKTWYDEEDILVGDSITTEINKALSKCDVVLVFLSEDSIKSNWVSEEWQIKFFAQVNSGKVYVLPLRLDDCVIPPLLRDKKYADFRKSEDYETSLSMLFKKLKKIEIENNALPVLKNNDHHSIFEYTRELLDDLEEEAIFLPTLTKNIPIIATLKKIKRSGKLFRLESFNNPKIKIRSIYDHILSVAHSADCLLPEIKSGISVENNIKLSKIIAFHELNEIILGDIPAFTNLRDKHRKSTANQAEQVLRTISPDKRKKIANEFIWLFLSEKQKSSLESVLKDLVQSESNLTIFFKILDKTDPIISIWRYLNYYRGKIGNINDFLKRLKDFFENSSIKDYISSTQYEDQLSDLIAVLQNRDFARQYYDNPNFFELNSDLFKISPPVLKPIIEGCPLFINET